MYTKGQFVGSADYDPGAGDTNFTGGGIFVSKLDSSGDFVWAKAMGTDLGGDRGERIVVDASGNVYTTGWFSDTVDFDPGAGTVELSSAGDYDIFVQKLDSDGNFICARAMGGTSQEWVSGIAVDVSGNAYTTEHFSDTADFDPGTSTVELTSEGEWDIFASKLDSSGNFAWVKHMGSTGFDSGRGITLDTSTNVYTTGDFHSTVDFDPSARTFELTSGAFGGMFVQKLDFAGNFLWAKAMGDTNGASGRGIAADASGNVYTTGFFRETADFDPGAGTFNLTSAGSLDIFVPKLLRTGYLVESWVDFGFVGSETGSEANPFDSLTEALIAVADPGAVKIKGNTGDSVSEETMTIDQDVTIEAINGTVRVGDPGVQSIINDQKSGFVSRD